MSGAGKVMMLAMMMMLSPVAYALSCEADCDHIANISLYNSLHLGAAIINVDLSSVFGTCPPAPGISLPEAYNLQSECYIWENLTNVQAKIHNGSGVGCWAEGPLASATSAAAEFIIYSNAGDVISGCDGPWLELCVNGTNVITAYELNTSTSDWNITLSTDNFTSNYRYNISYWYEENGSAYAIPAGELETEFFCTGDREGFPFHYTAAAQDTNIVITETPVRISNTVGNILQRRTYLTEAGGHKRVYLMGGEYSPYTLTLNDYTGGEFSDSSLTFEQGIAGELEVVENNSFDTSNILLFYAINGSEYRLTLKSDAGREVNLGFVEFTPANSDRTVTVSDAVISEFLGNYRGISVGFTQDYDSGQVGFTITSDSDISSFFNVSNASTNTYTHTYGDSSAADTVSYTYTIPNKLEPVYLEATITHPDYGTLHFRRLVLLYNQSLPLNSSAFNPMLPETIMGTNSSTVKKIIALFATMFVFYALTKATSYGVGSLAGVGTFSFMWYVNFIPHSEVPSFIIVIFALLATAALLFERRVSTAG